MLRYKFICCRFVVVAVVFLLHDWPLLFGFFFCLALVLSFVVFCKCFVATGFGLCVWFSLFFHWATNLYRSLGSWMTNHRWICIKFRFVFGLSQIIRTQTHTKRYMFYGLVILSHLFLFYIYKLFCGYFISRNVFHVDFDFELSAMKIYMLC